MHKRLEQQLREYLGNPASLPAGLSSFVEAVNRVYLEADEECAALMRALDTARGARADAVAPRDGGPADRQRSEEELNRAVSLLSATLESTADGILVVDRAGQMVLMNRRFIELWRIPEAIVAARDDTRALDFAIDQLADPEVFVQKVRELYDTPEAQSFDVLSFKDGRLFERYSLPQRIGHEIVGRVWSFRDVSVRHQLEDQLRHSQKMEAVGELAGGVAHDFNTLLTVISGHVELLADSLGAGHPALPDVADIRAAAERASALTHQLLAFSRKQILQPSALDLNDVIGTLLTMLRRLIGEDVELGFAPASVPLVVTADPTQMEQVIVNLVLNARDAMPDGGHIRIQTERVTLEATRSYERTHGLPSGQFVVVTVADTGHGIAPEHRSRVFEPFFSTKAVGKGTGLGLSTVFGIVTQSGGHVVLESSPGRGATFRVYLPHADSAISTVVATSPIATGARGTETIVVVEDEDGVRALVQRTLEARGYTVVAARDGEEALRLVAGRLDRVALLLTDVVMPGMGGVALAARMQAGAAHLRVLYMSGYAAEEIDRRGMTAVPGRLLRKPFTGADLVLAVRQVLDAPVTARAG